MSFGATEYIMRSILFGAAADGCRERTKFSEREQAHREPNGRACGVARPDRDEPAGASMQAFG